MTDVQALLHEALGDLPGGPIVPPVGLGLQAERLRVRRRRVQVAGAAAVAVVVAATSAVVGLQGSTGASAPLVPGLEPSASPGEVCEVPSSLVLAGSGRSAHTADEARQALFDGVSKRHGDLLFAGAGAAYPVVRAGELVWAVERLSAPPGGGPLPRSALLELFRDADLASMGTVGCALLPVLRGAVSDVVRTPVVVIPLPDRAPLAVSPVEPLTRDQASTPWIGRGVGDQLLVSFGTGCNDNAAVQVKETSSYVLVQVVRNGPASGRLCVSGESGKVVLDQPFGNRLLLHAALRDVLPSKAADRLPAYLPEGAKPLALPSVPRNLRAAWQLPDRRILSYFVGVFSPPDASPETVSMAGYEARFIGVRGHPTLQWQDGDATLQVRLTPAVGRPVISPLTELKLVAESLYTAQYVGLPLREAEALATSYGLASRVVSQDGKDLAVLGNLDPRRVGFDLVDGTVTAARFS